MLHIANAIGFVHILVQIWLTAGLPAALVLPRLARYYWGTMALALGSRLFYGACPLTVWQEGIKHRPDVEPLLSTHFTIEVAPTWLGMNPDFGDAQWLMLGSFISASFLLALRRRKTERPL